MKNSLVLALAFCGLSACASNPAMENRAPASPGQVDNSGNVLLMKQTDCHTDGCVFRKNAMFDAAFDWARSIDNCSSTETWLQSIQTIADNTFLIVCGDTSDTVNFTIQATNPLEATRADIKFRKIKEANSHNKVFPGN